MLDNFIATFLERIYLPYRGGCLTTSNNVGGSTETLLGPVVGKTLLHDHHNYMSKTPPLLTPSPHHHRLTHHSRHYHSTPSIHRSLTSLVPAHASASSNSAERRQWNNSEAAVISIGNPTSAPYTTNNRQRKLLQHLQQTAKKETANPVGSCKLLITSDNLENNINYVTKNSGNYNDYEMTSSGATNLPQTVLEKSTNSRTINNKSEFFPGNFANKDTNYPALSEFGNNILNVDDMIPDSAGSQRWLNITNNVKHIGNSNEGTNNSESSSSDSGYKSRTSAASKLLLLSSGDSLDSTTQHRTRSNVLNLGDGTCVDASYAKGRCGYSWKEDDSHLCADIETCDTLFLDIGAKEPPELLAARNLKGKIKKKKINKLTVCRNVDRISSPPNRSDLCENAFSKLVNDSDLAVSIVDCATDAETPTVKVKKKIKIVIGKRTKSKLCRKKSLDEGI